jgi:hypothetical protein
MLAPIVSIFFGKIVNRRIGMIYDRAIDAVQVNFFRRTNADLSLAELTLSSSDKAPTPNEDRPRFLLQRVGFKNFHTAVKAEGNEGYSGDMDVM